MSSITLIGLNHKTAPVEIRESLAFTTEDADDALKSLKKNKYIKEAMIFSTCNRMELLFISKDETKELIIEDVINFLSEYKKTAVSSFKDSLYIYNDNDAVKHLFRVASSLDSMILGEPQILGQVKSAYRSAVSCNASGVIINRLMHKAFSIAKKIRRETGIGDNAVSISYAAVELANKIFNDLSERKVMLLGAGEMAELAVEHFISHEVKNLYVANRTFENGVNLAQKFNGKCHNSCSAARSDKNSVNAKAVNFEERVDILKDIDIVVSSTGAIEYVITSADIKKIMQIRKNRPVFFIDIAVPRDIDPKIHDINNVYLYDIDDLQNIVDDNMDERKKEAVKAERLVDEAVIKFEKWLENLDVVPTIIAIREKIDKIAESEIEKTLTSLNLNVEQENAIKRMTCAIANKIMHDPISFLKNSGNHKDDSFYLNAAREIFNINSINGD